MGIAQRIKNAMAGFNTDGAIPIQRIPAGGSLLRDRGTPMYPEWTQSVVSPKDMYSGYPYAAINNRANGVADMAINDIKTLATQSIEEAASRKNEKLIHPYLELIDRSPSFTNYQFWFTTSAYLDLTGVAYVLVVRNAGDFRGKFTYGEIQEIELLNSYRVKPVINRSTRELEGYEEDLGEGEKNSIPLEMVIPIRKFNPFSDVEPYAPMDAAKDAQFTMKTSSDHTRASIQRNINAPGMITTATEMMGEELENFKARIYEHKKGKPLIGVGSTRALQWQDMQIDLDKAALMDVNQLSLDAIIAVTGNSRTTFGIEQSGVTRDTARVQSELFMANHVIPQLRLIIDTLNQDYKSSYTVDYDKTQYWMTIESPLKVDLDSDVKKQDLRDKQFTMYDRMLDEGYESELAALFVKGELDLAELGEPEKQPVPPQLVNLPQQTEDEDELEAENQRIINQAAERSSAPLEAAIVRIDQQLLGYAQANLGKAQNDFKETDLVRKKEKNQVERDLIVALASYYLAVMSGLGPQTTSERMAEFGLFAAYRVDSTTRDYINKTSKLAARSHIDTVLSDMMRTAQDGAAAGKGLDQITRDLQTKFNEQISTTRAKAIARTETNRAVTMSQYEADRQFIAQNGLEGRSFKKWIIRSDNPCAICKSLEGSVVPYGQPYLKEGEEIEASEVVNGETKIIKQTAWEDVQAGTVHVNCFCAYDLLIEGYNI